VYEATSSNNFLDSEKARVLEQEFNAISGSEFNMLSKSEQRPLVSKSDNQVKKEYFVSQLRKMHKRLRG
jgi:hypothetical protein